mgnify:CR=1 FL=1
MRALGFEMLGRDIARPIPTAFAGGRRESRRANVQHAIVRARRGERFRDGTFHAQNVNAFYSFFKAFLHPFCGPATWNPRRHIAWFVFRQQYGCDPKAAHLFFQRVLYNA